MNRRVTGVGDPGVSEVVGSLILVGVVVMGMILVGMLLLGKSAPSKVPVLDVIISNRSKVIYLYHKGGDSLWQGQFQILVNGGDQTANFTIMSPGTFPWSVGDTLSGSYPAVPATSMPKQVVVVFNNTMSGGVILVAVDLNQGVNAAPTFVQTAANSTASGRLLPITLPGSSTPGNLIVVSASWGNTGVDIQSVADSQANTYASAAGPTNSGTTARAETRYAKNIAATGTPITVTITLTGVPGGTTAFEGYVTEYSGISTANPLDQALSAAGSGLSINSGYVTTTLASELLYGYAWTSATSAPDPPLVLRSTSQRNFIADRSVSSIGSYRVTGSTADPGAGWICQIVTFRGG
jgi:hypothetical protein